MKRTVAALALLVAPSLAQAGVGLTWFHGTEYSTHYNYVSRYGALPSLDWRSEGHTVQFHLLDLIEGLSLGEDMRGDNAQINFGVNYYKTIDSGKTASDSPMKGVFQPGASLDITTSNADREKMDIAIQGLARLGVQSAKGYGFGIYVCPSAGFGMINQIDPSNGDTESGLELLVGGTLQVSAWTN